MADEIVYDLKPRNNVHIAVDSEDRMHVGDETCWCRPHVTATTITHRPLTAGSDEAIVDMVRFIAENGGAVEVNGVRIENLDQYNREDDKAQFALNEARARIAELEAAQRPPLGYVVLSKRRGLGPNSYGYDPVGYVRYDLKSAERHLRYFRDKAAEAFQAWETDVLAKYVVAELREVTE